MNGYRAYKSKTLVIKIVQSQSISIIDNKPDLNTINVSNNRSIKIHTIFKIYICYSANSFGAACGPLFKANLKLKNKKYKRLLLKHEYTQ